MPSGIMKRWHDEKGFGFITPDDGGEDVFCHVSGLLDGEGSVQEGDDVRFQVKYDERKGKDRADKVERKGGGGGGRPRDRSRSRGGGGGGGGKGGGKGKAGDWECPACGKNVFASKNECFACGEPKPRGGGGGRRDASRSRGRGRGRDDSRDRGRRR